MSVCLFHSLLAFDYKLQPKSVNTSNSVHCFFGYSEVMNKRNNGNISNSCFVNVGTSYLVIDSGSTFLYAAQAYAKIKQIQNLPISYVVNTHVHDDHWLGNSYYKTLNAKIIASLAFKKLPIKEVTRMQRRISKDAYEKTEQILPTYFVEDEKTLNLNGTKVILKSVNYKAHTHSDLYIYIPSEKIVFVGDLVFNDRIPSIRDGELSGWIDVLGEIRSLDAQYIIGGHGKLISRQSIDMTYNYLSELRESVSKLLENGVDLVDVVKIVDMSAYKNVNLYDSMHRQNVETAYRMLEWGI